MDKAKGKHQQFHAFAFMVYWSGTPGQSLILKDFDPENKHRLFIKWDRNYINFSPEGNQLSGFWHINAHKPEITLLPHQEGSENENWRIEVNEKC